MSQSDQSGQAPSRPAASGKEIHLYHEEKQSGPFNINQVRRQFEAGEIGGDTHAWYEGLDAWIPLTEVPEIAKLEKASDEKPGSVLVPGSPGAALKSILPLDPLERYDMAGVPKRFVAFLFDAVFLLVLSTGIIMKMGNSIWSGLIIQILLVGYHAFFESGARAGTPGKKMMGLATIGGDGNEIDMKRALIRSFVKINVSSFLLIGFIMAAFDEKGRALHDKSADTLVVQTGT